MCMCHSTVCIYVCVNNYVLYYSWIIVCLNVLMWTLLRLANGLKQIQIKILSNQNQLQLYLQTVVAKLHPESKGSSINYFLLYYLFMGIFIFLLAKRCQTISFIATLQHILLWKNHTPRKPQYPCYKQVSVKQDKSCRSVIIGTLWSFQLN